MHHRSTLVGKLLLFIRSAVFESLRQEYRRHRMARFAVWVLAYGGGLWLAGRLTGGAPNSLWLLFWACILAVGIYYFARWVGFVRHRLLWPLRHRLIVTYLFIAVVPILLILFLTALGAFIISGQFAAFFVLTNLRNHFDELEQLNRAVVHEARQVSWASPQVLLDRLQRFYAAELSQHATSYPGLEITIRIGSQARAFDLQSNPLPRSLDVPVWLTHEEFAGIVLDQDAIALRAAARAPTSAGELIVILSQPLSPELLDQVGSGLGPVGVLVPRAEKDEPHSAAPHPGSWVRSPQSRFLPTGNLRSKSVPLPKPSTFLDMAVVGATTVDPILWGGDSQQHPGKPIFLYVTTRIVTLNEQILSTLGEISRFYVFAFKVVAVIFLLIEISALVIGIQLTRSMTTTVDTLHAATERVKAGDFSYRIHMPARDQLSALGEAFDSMTTSIERLLRESKEKSRLESEIEIAQQVQRQMFPDAPPKLPGLQLYGVCNPARSVSGDFYDFLRLSEDRVGLVLGDVSGKGISAALLMATIQAALHAQLYDGHYPREILESLPISTADVARRLNRQLFENTPLENYATLFYAVYDATTRKLIYTNAGHLPPFLLRRDRIERLDTGGTVVGLFASMTYEQAEIQFEPGDVLLAFTDGITEPENSFGEEFGETRVLEVAKRSLSSAPEALVREIYQQVMDWTGSPELQDDMTLLVAKAVA